MSNLTSEQVASFFEATEELDREGFEASWLAMGDLLAHSSDDAAVLFQQCAIEVIKQYSGYCHKLLGLLRSLKTSEAILRYRERLFHPYQGESFEAIVESGLHQLQYWNGDLLLSGLAYGYQYACALLVKSDPEIAIGYFTMLVQEAKSNRWNEGDGSVRALLRKISLFTRYIFGLGARIEDNISSRLLTSEMPGLRGAEAACQIDLILSRYSWKEFKLDWQKVVSNLKDALADVEYRICLAIMIKHARFRRFSEIGEAVLYQLLTEEWVGDMELIERIIPILCGPLYANNSISITENFLVPLEEKKCLDANLAFAYWNKVFLGKIAYRKDFVGNNDKNSFSSTTDVELSNCIISLFLEQTEELQSATFLEWQVEINPMLNFLSQPFAKNRNHSFAKCCERVYWMKLILTRLIESGKITRLVSEKFSNYLDQHRQIFERSNRYVAHAEMLVGKLS